ncbi:hypothetical protein CL621_02945 [archaeon]|nr:hypothetical protein [archaeon]
MATKKKLICFDMDGTLLDATMSHAKAYFKSIEKNNLRKVSKKKLLFNFGLVGKVVIRKTYPKLSEKEIKKIIKDHFYFLMNETYKSAKPINGVKNTIKSLRKNFKIALISNCNRKSMLILLKKTGFKKEWFDLILGSDGIKNPKPAPDSILKAEKLLKMKAEYMVGDTIYDIKAGKAAKTKTIAVLTGNHTRKRLKKENPYLIVKSVAKLRKIL